MQSCHDSGPLRVQIKKIKCNSYPKTKAALMPVDAGSEFNKSTTNHNDVQGTPAESAPAGDTVRNRIARCSFQETVQGISCCDASARHSKVMVLLFKMSCFTTSAGLQSWRRLRNKLSVRVTCLHTQSEENTLVQWKDVCLGDWISGGPCNRKFKRLLGAIYTL